MDNFRNVKYIGYCFAKRPPEGARETLEDYVNYCKFQLCIVNNKLMKDPVWESYDDADILSEYFAHAMVKDEDFAKEFIMQLKGIDTDVYNWLDAQVEQNQKEFKEMAMDQDLEDEIDFAPDALGD